MDTKVAKDIRLYVGESAKKNIAKIDKKKLLSLHSEKIDRIELYMYAMAKGIIGKAPLPISESKESFVRQISVPIDFDSLMLSF